MFSTRRILGLAAFLIAFGLSVYQFMLNPKSHWYWTIIAAALLVMVVASLYLMKQDIDHSRTLTKPRSKAKKK